MILTVYPPSLLPGHKSFSNLFSFIIRCWTFAVRCFFFRPLTITQRLKDRSPCQPDQTSLITQLEQRRRPHAAADTHGLHAVFLTSLPHIV